MSRTSSALGTASQPLEKLSLETIGHNCPRAGPFPQICNNPDTKFSASEFRCRGARVPRAVTSEENLAPNHLISTNGNAKIWRNHHPHKHKSKQQISSFSASKPAANEAPAHLDHTDHPSTTNHRQQHRTYPAAAPKQYEGRLGTNDRT